MIRAFIGGMAIAITAPLIGMFLVVRRYSLMADTLAHVSLVGVAFGILLGINPVLAALATSVLAAIGIEHIRATSKYIFGESILALFLSGSLAIAAVLLSFARGFNVSLFSFLFGSITIVSPFDVYLILGVNTFVVFAVLLLYKELFFVSFDEETARAVGVPSVFINMVLVILTAVVVSLAMRIVGILLVGALMVIPVLAAMQFGKGFRYTVVFSIILSLFSVVVGLFLSFYLDLASGGTIVVVALSVFLLSFFLNRGD